jgi:ribonuclease HI
MLFWCVRNIEYCISEGISTRAISICSDSRAVLLALKSYAVSSRVVLQCGYPLQELALSNRVRLVWVLGHCGIHGNEEADALARTGQVLLCGAGALPSECHLFTLLNINLLT